MSSHGGAGSASDGERRLARQLDIAGELARLGAQPIGRELCASIFLEHSSLLLTDRDSKQRFIECLLLLRMSNLMTRLLSATDGVELKVTTLVVQGAERLLLSFGADASLSVPLAEMGSDRATRERFAARWSERILLTVDKLANARSETRQGLETAIS